MPPTVSSEQADPMRPTSWELAASLVAAVRAALGGAQAVLGRDLDGMAHELAVRSSTAIGDRVSSSPAEGCVRTRLDAPRADDERLAGRDLHDTQRVLGRLGGDRHDRREGKQACRPKDTKSSMVHVRFNSSARGWRRWGSHAGVPGRSGDGAGPGSRAAQVVPPILRPSCAPPPPGSVATSPSPHRAQRDCGGVTVKWHGPRVTAGAFAYHQTAGVSECRRARRAPAGRVRTGPRSGPGTPGAARSRTVPYPGCGAGGPGLLDARTPHRPRRTPSPRSAGARPESTGIATIVERTEVQMSHPCDGRFSRPRHPLALRQGSGPSRCR